MQMHFNEAPQATNNSYGGNYSEPKQFENNIETDDFDNLYQKYRAYRQTGTKFENRYEIRKDAGFFGSLVPKFLKGSP